MKKLPLGITTFADIRDPEENYLYIDKTALAAELINKGRYYFLSRPRRFGKSLFLDTLNSLFQGHKKLFKGLDIEQQWDWNKSYPVINISLNSGEFTTAEDIKESILFNLQRNLEQLGLTCTKNTHIPSCFAQVISKASQKYQQKVVILIDEYDKPILDNITDNETAQIARNILKSFYSVIKDHDQYIKFVFITGVSKFSKMNLFSGLNNLIDITTLSDYATLCGYTHHDIQTQFAEHLQGVDLEKVKQWYNGYSYYPECKQCSVYNPYDILLFISHHHEYKNYWWSTGNPSFLIETLKQQNYYIPALENIIVSEEILDTFDIDYIDLIALLWQTGYLTFDKKLIKRDKLFYQLKVPNKEIQSSLNELFIRYLTSQTVEAITHQDNLYDALSGDINQFKLALASLFASIPYNNYANNIIANYEGYYASVVFTYILSLGYPCIAEDVTSKGRIDLTIKLPQRIIIIEFKVDQDEQALAQIKQKKYYEKYLTQGQDVYIIGIGFNSKEKNISDYQWEKIKPC